MTYWLKASAFIVLSLSKYGGWNKLCFPRFPHQVLFITNLLPDIYIALLTVCQRNAYSNLGKINIEMIHVCFWGLKHGFNLFWLTIWEYL